MSHRNKQVTGGLILQKQEIETILNEPAAEGIAFALKQPGRARDVDLTVLLVSRPNGSLVGEQREVISRRGARSNFHFPDGSVADYLFADIDRLESDGFFFGYFPKSTLLELFAAHPDWTEVFIGGGYQRFPAYVASSEKEAWYNLALALRRSVPTRTLVSANSEKGRYPVAHRSADSLEEDLVLDRSLAVLPKEPVTQITLSENGQWIVGLELQNGDRRRFSERARITSVYLDDNNQLLALYDDRPELDSKESLALGSLPYFQWAIGCPPQWPEDGEDNEHDDVRKAVEEGLK